MTDKRFSDYTPKEQRGGCVMLLVFLCLIGGCYKCILSDDKPSYSTRSNIPSEDQIYAFAETIISNKLAAPSTAKFPPVGQISKRDDGIYVIMSYVDAQNVYGAMLRQYWICQLKYKGGNWDNGNSWEIVEATFM